MEETRRPYSRAPRHYLDDLFEALDVDFVQLSECLISSGWNLALHTNQSTGIHYVLSGGGRMLVAGSPLAELTPHTLVIAPPRSNLILQAPHANGTYTTDNLIETRLSDNNSVVRRNIAGNTPPKLIVICGYFRATFASAVDVFSALPSPIVENFSATDQLDTKLKGALGELLAQEVGAGAMSTALMIGVLITLMRRTLSAGSIWAERFTILKDPKIARAFSQMVARPGAAHTVQTLALASGLSRSSFMARFVEIFDESPITVLRRLRMRHANGLLKAGNFSLEQVAKLVGYSNSGSFSRAYKKAYGRDL
jgi:AraC-like DNA-binding protein